MYETGYILKYLATIAVACSKLRII